MDLLQWLQWTVTFDLIIFLSSVWPNLAVNSELLNGSGNVVASWM